MSPVVLQTASRTLLHTVVVFSLFLLFAGHDLPGGGFIGGLVAGAALVLWHVAFGAEDCRALVRISSLTLLGVGVGVAALAGVVGLAAGGSFLEKVAVELPSLPALGSIKLTTVLAFDVGIYLIVVGTVLMLVESLGQEMDP